MTKSKTTTAPFSEGRDDVAAPDDTNQQILGCLQRIEEMLASICAANRKMASQHEEYCRTVRQHAAPKGEDQFL